MVGEFQILLKALALNIKLENLKVFCLWENGGKVHYVLTTSLLLLLTILEDVLC